MNRLLFAPAEDKQSVSIITESVKMGNALSVSSNTKFEAQNQEDDSKSPTSRAASMPGMIDSNKCDKVAGGDCMFDLPVPSIDRDMFDYIYYQLRSRTTHTAATRAEECDIIVDTRKGEDGCDDDNEDKESLGTLSDDEIYGSSATRAAADSRDRGGVDDSSDEEYPLLPRNFISRERFDAFEQFIADGGQIEFMVEMQSRGSIHCQSLCMEID